MDFREMGVRSKWREEAEMKESHRMEVLESFERALDESAYAKFKECGFPFLDSGEHVRLTLLSVHRCPAFPLEADALRRAFWACEQDQTAARYLSERFGRQT